MCSFAFFCKRAKCSRVLLRSLQKNETFFAKERNVLCVLLGSLQKIVAFSAFFYILKNRMHHSFGSHKSPKTRKKNVKECCVLLKKKRCVQNGKERGAQPWDTGKKGCRIGEMLDHGACKKGDMLDSRQVEYRTGGMLERRDAGKERHRRGGMQESMDSRGNECRKEVMQEMRNIKFVFVHAWQEFQYYGVN